MAKADRFYYDNFVQAAECCCHAAKYLVRALERYDYDNLYFMMEAMHACEHSADIIHHQMTAALAKAFVTPMDREDMAEISANIDAVADSIEEVLQRFYVHRIKTVLPDALVFARKIDECCETLQEMLVELPTFKKPKKLRELILKVNHLEEECDRLYLQFTMEVPDHCDHVLEIIAWREIFELMESCTDACEHVCDCVELLVMKNT